MRAWNGTGKQNNQWQDRDSVLAQFGKSETQAIEGYRRYVAEVRRWGDGPSWWEARVGGGTENGR